MVPFSFAGHELCLIKGRALYWPREKALIVADLHLEKASFFASHGQMLPPYDSRETLGRLAQAVRETGARRVIALGDNFHDGPGTERLDPCAAGVLATLTRTTDWVWIAGNHDGEAAAALGGSVCEELELGGFTMRHKASATGATPELSGHFHPRLAVSARGRRIARVCVVVSESRMILPAFGALTGGMNAADPAILAAMLPARTIDAVVAAGSRLVRYPLWRSPA